MAIKQTRLEVHMNDYEIMAVICTTSAILLAVVFYKDSTHQSMSNRIGAIIVGAGAGAIGGLIVFLIGAAIMSGISRAGH